MWVLDGVCEYHNLALPKGAGIETDSTGAFEVALGGGQWIVSYENLSARNSKEAMYARVDASCDGQAVYIVHHLNPLAVPRGVIMTEAHIYPGVMPPPMERDSYNLWLAFVSSSLWSNAQGRAKPPATPDLSLFYNTNFSCEYKWVTNSRPDSVRTLTLRSDGRILTRDIHHHGELRSVSLPPPYTNGYTLAEANWLGATNLAGRSLPLQYQFVSFSPRPGASSRNDLDKYSSFDCVTTNCHAAEDRPIPAGMSIEDTALVADHRFAAKGVATLTYGVTGSLSTAISPQLAALASVAPKKSLEAASLQQHGFDIGDKHVFAKISTKFLLTAAVLAPLVIVSIRKFSGLRKGFARPGNGS